MSSRARAWFVVLGTVAASAACRSVEVVDGSGGGRTAVAVGATTGAGGDEGACNLPPPPSATIPPGQGCYENDQGQGWVVVPCACELWLASTSHAPVTATLELTLTPPTPSPTLTGLPKVGIDFDDPDASFYGAWVSAPGAGATFSVTHQGATTTVRMGESHLALPPVDVAACSTRKGKAFIDVTGPAKVSVRAALDDGSVVETSCAPIPVTGP
jgi:hypothetical protein